MNLRQEKQTAHYEDKVSHALLVRAIRSYLPSPGTNPLVIVCIGTDRSTGDSLGPLAGTFLQKHTIPDTYIYGTLENPVHAVNLEDTLSTIAASYRNPFIIAIDACLGKQKNIGMISVSKGPVLPGAGVNKKLLPVGDINITGIVNVSGFMEYSVLQNTRLNIVMSLSEVISRCLYLAILSRDKAGLPARMHLSRH
ncbi:spore protease YyaC [Sporolactobacillus sp. CQH2019]|uniref:spore protease YyaC n=1 Tax=Sporolactobacillus sp. CQH2019 TaxID=3023512 RepID=UPI0023681EA1|nr:spore protease YyaC [Sporolactobacillus sp. CQH2019]MDD9148484.1 spore protease YyaC [Sporolactobacillus sp. CQH2019]